MLQPVTLGLRSGERNKELVLLAAAAGFLITAWHALDAASVSLPQGSLKIVLQFGATGLLAHAGLRVIAPGAHPVPLPAALLLAAVGLAFVMRLSPELAQDQANWISLGCLLCLAAAAVGRKYQLLRGYTYTAAGGAIALLAVTGLFGETVNGARLWLSIGGHPVQTTEMIKVLLVIFLAGYLDKEAAVLAASRLRFGGRTYTALPYLLPLLFALILAMGALALLRDLGTIALLLLVSVAALYVATGRVRFVTGGAVLLVLVSIAGYNAFDHVHARVDAWRDPFSVADTSGYQTVQSVFSFEAGGVTGTGLGAGSPVTIPEVETDYIFVAIAEELGLAGAGGVVLLVTVLMFSGFQVAIAAGDGYARLLAACITLMIALQASVIIAGNLRLMPTTGITLPFVSYGGSSLAVSFALIGILLGISQAAKAPPLRA